MFLRLNVRMELLNCMVTVTFRVEVADTKASRARGLMHREHLAAQSGMLFLYPAPQSVSFWMRNTLIPLDMLFIDQAGLVSMIHHRAEPHDEKLIYGDKEVLSVLEINSGVATQLGITLRSEVQSPLLPQKAPLGPVRKIYIKQAFSIPNGQVRHPLGSGRSAVW